MPTKAALRPRSLAPVAAGCLASATLLRPRTAFAEELPRKSRKPIYDEPHSLPSPPAPDPTTPPESSSPDAPSTEPPENHGPTPTDRLTVQIRNARLKLFDYSLQAEKSLNTFMKRAFAVEKDFTQTVASLAPPADSDEAVMPGLIYVLVATLAGSIVTRNRGIILRTGVPLAFGTTAAYAAIPITMQNVGNLYERYESKYPEVHRMHKQMNEQSQYIWETSKAHSAMTVQRGEDLLNEARKKMEDWVRQGK